jgi:hypothetical protein
VLAAFFGADPFFAAAGACPPADAAVTSNIERAPRDRTIRQLMEHLALL